MVWLAAAGRWDLVQEKVVAVEAVEAEGMYNPYTNEGATCLPAKYTFTQAQPSMACTHGKICYPRPSSVSSMHATTVSLTGVRCCRAWLSTQKPAVNTSGCIRQH